MSNPECVPMFGAMKALADFEDKCTNISFGKPVRFAVVWSDEPLETGPTYDTLAQAVTSSCLRSDKIRRNARNVRAIDGLTFRENDKEILVLLRRDIFARLSHEAHLHTHWLEMHTSERSPRRTGSMLWSQLCWDGGDHGA